MDSLGGCSACSGTFRRCKHPFPMRPVTMMATATTISTIAVITVVAVMPAVPFPIPIVATAGIAVVARSMHACGLRGRW